SGFPPPTEETQSTLWPTTSMIRERSGENEMCEPPIISANDCGSPPPHRHLHRGRLTAAGTPENNLSAVIRPAHEVPHHANVRQPTRVAAVNVHDPDF